MATFPLSASTVRVLPDCRLYPDQQNTRWFSSLANQLAFFNAKTPLFQNTQMNFTKEVNGEYSVHIPVHIDNLINATYLMFQNTQYTNKWFYCFITRKTYKASNSTQLFLKLDVIQTWMFDITFRPSYVVREHAPQYISANNPFINTQDEGLNYGLDYDLVSSQHIQIANGLKWLVIVSKQAFHIDPDTLEPVNEIIPTVIGGSPQPLSFYLVPFINGDTGVNVSNLGIPISKPSDVLKAVYTQTNAVNNIVSIYISEHVGLPFIYSGGSSMNIALTTDNIQGVIVSDYVTDTDFNCIYVKHIDSFSNREVALSNIFTGYRSVTESKLLMYPYTKLVMVDMKGNLYEYRNESFSSRTPSLIVKGSLGTSNKVSYSFDQYNTSGTNATTLLLSDQQGIINSDPMDLPVLTDMLSAYLQGNRNSIQNAKSQASFNASMSAVNAGVGAVGSIIGKNPVGAVGAVTEGIQNVGNSIYEIQAINAKQKDIDNVPPTLSVQGSNSYYTYGNGQTGVFLLKYQIKPEYQNILQNFFSMYGYKSNLVKIPNLHSRQNWNYVQTEGCNITGSMAVDNMIEIRNIFNSGITLWHTDDIGNYALPNGVI